MALKLARMKSNIQTYDIGDSEDYSDVMEIEVLLGAQMMQGDVSKAAANSLREMFSNRKKFIDFKKMQDYYTRKPLKLKFNAEPKNCERLNFERTCKIPKKFKINPGYSKSDNKYTT